MNPQIYMLTQQKANARTNHILHLILSIITAGLWIPIWILMAIFNAMERSSCDRRIQEALALDAQMHGNRSRP